MIKKMKRNLALLWAAAAMAQTTPDTPFRAFDVVVYGGTAGGVMTAVSAARMGGPGKSLTVALLEPRRHIGGMVSGGLSHTDVGKREVIGGQALEFYWRAGNHYGLPQYLQNFAWYVEPKVAETILRDMLRQAGVDLFLERRLREKDGVQKSGARVESIRMENGERFGARVFVDASYEGDVMAQAGVSFTWGRESSAQYGESLAGVRAETPKHQFLVDLAPSGEEFSRDPGSPGAADRKVRAYNFRLIFSHDPANQAPYPAPTRYDPKRFDLFARFLDAMQRKLGRATRLGDVLSIGPIPNQKADFNNNGPISTDYIGKSWDYPNASYARREEIWRDDEDYTRPLLSFLA